MESKPAHDCYKAFMEKEKKSEKERGNKQKTNSAYSKSKSLNLT
jgi:hypothetical protein